MRRIHFTSELLTHPCRAQTLIMFTLLVTGIFMFFALAIDLGFAYSGRRFMQNSADAAAMAAARELALNVTNVDGQVGYVTTDGKVRSIVLEYVQDNQGFDHAGATLRTPKIEYLDVNGNVLGTSPTVGDKVPYNSAMLRVSAGVEYNALFARFINSSHSQLKASARATARISPVNKPSSAPGPTWPLTRWNSGILTHDDGDACPAPLEFWDSNPPSPGGTGDWKMLVWLGRASARVKPPDATYQHTQLLREYEDPPVGPYPYFSTGPADLSGNDVATQMEYWLTNGWNGKLNKGAYLSPAPSADDEPAVGAGGNWQSFNTAGTYGDKGETVGGNLGNNVSSSLKTFVQNHVIGNDPCGGDYTIVNIYLWDTNTTEQWKTTGGPPRFVTGGSSIDRVSFADWKPFKFYTGTASFTSASEVRGYPLSPVLDDVPPGVGPPSTTEGNTVHLVE